MCRVQRLGSKQAGSRACDTYNYCTLPVHSALTTSDTAHPIYAYAGAAVSELHCACLKCQGPGTFVPSTTLRTTAADEAAEVRAQARERGGQQLAGDLFGRHRAVPPAPHLGCRRVRWL